MERNDIPVIKPFVCNGLYYVYDALWNLSMSQHIFGTISLFPCFAETAAALLQKNRRTKIVLQYPILFFLNCFIKIF